MIQINYLGLQLYQKTYQAMQHFTQKRSDNTLDQIWLLEHPAIYTAGKSEKNIQNNLNIPLIQVDRGGKTTYHGPGQLIIYLMLNLKQYQIGVRSLLNIIEQSTIKCLDTLNIPNAYAKASAPGIYIKEKKIASVGLRIHRYFCYHGLSINFNCDLTPFNQITPCGQKNLKTTSIERETKKKYTDQSKIKWHWALAQLIQQTLINQKTTQ